MPLRTPPPSNPHTLLTRLRYCLNKSIWWLFDSFKTMHLHVLLNKQIKLKESGLNLLFQMSFLKEFRKDVLDYCSTSSIQGLSNVVDPKQSCLSRILWMSVIVASFVLSGICIKQSIEGKGQSKNSS
jgi:hypothetical protein